MIVRPDSDPEDGRQREASELVPASAAPPAAPNATIASHRHPTLGLPPVDMTAAFPAAAEAIKRRAVVQAGRALEVALEIDPSFVERYDEIGFRRLTRDTQLLIERAARCVASGDPRWLREWAEQTCPVYRRRGVPMADMMAICEGIREAYGPSLSDEERVPFDSGLDHAEAVYEWHSQLAGDRRKRNSLLKFLYRGA